MKFIKVLINNYYMIKLEENTLSEEEKIKIINNSINQSDKLYECIFQKLSKDLKYIQENNVKLPYVSDLKIEDEIIRLGIYSSHYFDWVSKKTKQIDKFYKIYI